jgi:hypothetical protein
MQFKKYTKQRNGSIQGLRSFKDTLPKNIKKVINKRGVIYSETLNNWKYIVGDNLFNVCYPKSFKNSNKFGESTLLIMVKRGHEIDLEYSKKEIINRMNNFFGEIVVKKLRFSFFDDESNIQIKKDYFQEKKGKQKKDVTNLKFKKKINNIENEKIKKSLIELTKVFREK